MNNITKVRIPKELRKIQQGKETNGITCSTHPDDPNNYTKLLATIKGPQDSPYDGGEFKLSILIGDQYPFTPPMITFITPVYHPNIDRFGKICLDLLRLPPGSYNPAITLESLLLSIQLLLANPNPEDPLQADVADLFKTNRLKFNQKVAETMQQNTGQKTRKKKNNDESVNEISTKKLKLN